MRDAMTLMATLERQIARMDFFQFMRLIENAWPDLPRLGSSLRARDDAVRLVQEPSLQFHASALAALLPAGVRAGGKVRLAVNFFGLLGPHAPMPIHFTEYVRERLRNGGDATPAAFLDIFHHRLLCLFYRARALAEPVICLDRPAQDRYASHVGSLCGFAAGGALRPDGWLNAGDGRDGDDSSEAGRARNAGNLNNANNGSDIGEFARLHFAGLLAGRHRPASGLVKILRAYFGLPLRLEQFAGRWMTLPPDSLTRLAQGDVAQPGTACGAEGNRLGFSTVLGRAVWDRQHHFRLLSGPLSLADYCRLLPGSVTLSRLCVWIDTYVDPTLVWDLQLVLAPEATPPLTLGAGGRLGWTTWLAGRCAGGGRTGALVRPQARAPAGEMTRSQRMPAA